MDELRDALNKFEENKLKKDQGNEFILTDTIFDDFNSDQHASHQD